MSEEHSVDSVWEKEKELVVKIVAATSSSGNMQQVYDSIPNKKMMSLDNGEILEIICMDGRLNESEKQSRVYARDGGSGILRAAEGLEKIAEDYMRAAMELGVSTIRLTSHSDCGAWNLSGKDQKGGEKFYAELQQALVKKISEADLPIEVIFEHIPNDKHNKEGAGLCGSHVERAVYYAALPSFNPQAVPGLPTGFVVSREYFSPNYAITNTAIAIKIAFGEHGFGERFSDGQPFLLVAVARSEEKLEEAKAELEQAKALAIEKYLKDVLKADEKIKVTGFVVGE